MTIFVIAIFKIVCKVGSKGCVIYGKACCYEATKATCGPLIFDDVPEYGHHSRFRINTVRREREPSLAPLIIFASHQL